MPENSILSPVSLTSYFDNATGEARQANLFFYKAGTLDPITAYTDSVLHIPFPQPVATTGWGRVPPVYIGEIPPPGYRVRAFDAYQTLIEDLDGLPGAVPTVPFEQGSALTPEQEQAIAHTGDIKLSWQNHQTLIGWVEITKGGTIGNVGSGASLMAHEDAHALFLHLWQQDALAQNDVVLKVLPSKGANAEGDWSGAGGVKKTIQVPDCRGRFLAGMDGQDTAVVPPADPVSLTLRMDKALFENFPNKAVKMNSWTLGASGGESVHKLLVTEMAVHLHDWIDKVGHTHKVWDTGHDHVLNDPGHTHGTVLTSAGDSNLIVMRTDTSPDYWLGGVGGTKAWKSGSLSTQQFGTGITLGRSPTSAPNVLGDTYLINNNFHGAGGGAGQTLVWVGTYGADGQWHQATENMPRPSDWSVVEERGDLPHNNAPPFILFAVYMKL